MQVWADAFDQASPATRPANDQVPARSNRYGREHVPDIIKALVEQAMTGDVGAARLLLERTLPPVKPAQEPMKIPMPGETQTAKAGAILDALAQGRLSVSDGKALTNSPSASKP